ncbi:serine protease [uncultured Roseobacter sp.]|uniref:S1 family peptidase n=1 Tax=uncultured Roseobacter sp. TaxID=114847 RepID=UPI002616988C|nr:serine protease [uncultured Roseobacter sp.]
MRTEALETVVRFLNTAGDKWVGTGFLVPPEKGSQGVYVMTCAHVVAEALGDAAIGTRAEAPEGTLSLIFRDQTQEVYQARVVPGSWRPAPEKATDPGGAIDIAVLEVLELEARPDGTRWPSFSDKPKSGQPMIAFGPRRRGHTALSKKAHWPRGMLTEPNRSDEIEFLMKGDINDNIIFGGFSGGPLTASGTYEVLGMVRSVQSGESRRAYAIPVSLLAEVWKPMLARRARPQSSLHPVFDLIARESQADIVSRATRLRIEARTEQGTGHAPMTFLVCGPFDEDHAHMNRRAFLEIAEHRERGPDGAADISYRPLKFPDGHSAEERLLLLREGLLKGSNAAGTSTEELRTALELASPDGWLFHLTLRQDVSDEDASVLRGFLDIWDEIAATAACELYLHLSFTYDSAQNTDCGAATLHTTLISEPDTDFVNLPPLQPVGPEEIAFWSQKIHADGLIEDDAVASELMFRVEDLLEGRPSLPMRQLRRKITREKIDPANL